MLRRGGGDRIVSINALGVCNPLHPQTRGGNTHQLVYLGRRRGQQQAPVVAVEAPLAIGRVANGPASDRAQDLISANLDSLKDQLTYVLNERSSTPLPSSLRPFSYWDQLKVGRQESSTVKSIEPGTTSKTRHVIPPMIPYRNATAIHDEPENFNPTFSFPLSVDHQLIVLVQFNVLRAMMTNMSILSLQHRLPSECSAAFSIACLPEAPSSIPPSLQPTTLQESVEHDPWIDNDPHPSDEGQSGSAPSVD